MKMKALSKIGSGSLTAQLKISDGTGPLADQ